MRISQNRCQTVISLFKLQNMLGPRKAHDLDLTSSSEQKHEKLLLGMAVKSVAIQLAHVVCQLRVVVEDVAHESIDARSRVLHPLHKETISEFQKMSIY
jgi:hypothetical protein